MAEILWPWLHWIIIMVRLCFQICEKCAVEPEWGTYGLWMGEHFTLAIGQWVQQLSSWTMSSWTMNPMVGLCSWAASSMMNMAKSSYDELSPLFKTKTWCTMGLIVHSKVPWRVYWVWDGVWVLAVSDTRGAGWGIQSELGGLKPHAWVNGVSAA